MKKHMKLMSEIKPGDRKEDNGNHCRLRCVPIPL